jgi:hypothetical protein
MYVADFSLWDSPPKPRNKYRHRISVKHKKCHETEK